MTRRIMGNRNLKNKKKVAEIWMKSQMGNGAAMSQYGLTNKEWNKALFFFFHILLEAETQWDCSSCHLGPQ